MRHCRKLLDADLSLAERKMPHQHTARHVEFDTIGETQRNAIDCDGRRCRIGHRKANVTFAGKAVSRFVVGNRHLLEDAIQIDPRRARSLPGTA
jgi:hypothetical protein